jgi:hypothetical protein
VHEILVSELDSQESFEEKNMIPSPRTYHASTVIADYMVVIGGEADSDLNDLWMLNFDDFIWY